MQRSTSLSFRALLMPNQLGNRGSSGPVRRALARGFGNGPVKEALGRGLGKTDGGAGGGTGPAFGGTAFAVGCSLTFDVTFTAALDGVAFGGVFGGIQYLRLAGLNSSLEPLDLTRLWSHSTPIPEPAILFGVRDRVLGGWTATGGGLGCG